MAEDNDSNYALLIHVLKDYDLMRAENGVEAVDAVRNGNLDFVLMDLKMPIGMTVGELTRKTATYVNTILLTIVMQKITLPVTTIVSCVMQIS